jgi:hypothetical protein
MIAVPITLLIFILILRDFAFRARIDSAIPLSAIGGIFFLHKRNAFQYQRGLLFGVAVLNVVKCVNCRN